MVNKSIKEQTDPEILAELGGRLRALRKAQKLSLEAVASRTGLDRGTVSRAEHGDNPTMLTVLRLLRAYGRLSSLGTFIPESEVSPMEMVRQYRRGQHRG
jgi:transcriptional regulator with XRE-family HTH domain